MFQLDRKGFPEINFAKTVREVANLGNDYAARIMNRNRPLDESTVDAIANLATLSYEGRSPKPALDADGNFQTTDLDLLSFLVPLAARGAVIEIPCYENRRQTVKRVGERRIGSNRFGRLTGLVSNRDIFSFSVKIKDQSVISEDRKTGVEAIGAFRNFMVVDLDGRLYDGWKRIVWKPNAEENAFLATNRLFTGNAVYFKNAVHPNRWQSVFGAPYLIAKLLISRIDDEAGFYRREVGRLLAAGIKFPAGMKPKTRMAYSTGQTKSILVKTLEMSLDLPGFTGKYRSVPATQTGLKQAYERQRLLTYGWKPLVLFVVRADELAFLLYGFDGNGEAKVASWLPGAKWTLGRKNSRTALSNRLMLGRFMALRYRIKTKTERVAA